MNKSMTLILRKLWIKRNIFITLIIPKFLDMGSVFTISSAFVNILGAFDGTYELLLLEDLFKEADKSTNICIQV